VVENLPEKKPRREINLHVVEAMAVASAETMPKARERIMTKVVKRRREVQVRLQATTPKGERMKRHLRQGKRE